MANIDFWTKEEARCDFDDQFDEESSLSSPSTKIAVCLPSCVRHQSKLHSDQKLEVLSMRVCESGKQRLGLQIKKTQSVADKSTPYSPVHDVKKSKHKAPKVLCDIQHDSATGEMRLESPEKSLDFESLMKATPVPEPKECAKMGNKDKNKRRSNIKDFYQKHKHTLCKTVLENSKQTKGLNPNKERRKNSEQSVKELLVSLVRRRRMSSIGDFCTPPKKSHSVMRKHKRSPDDGLCPAKLNDRSATLKQECVLVTMNDIGAIE
ncbi:unnamed protein product [Moneuplotes crassus]|uniref:Uncharacterized protein n=1 Tax=Euplotes crassus TaxID=5936 RepID=A0AAD1UMQ6_EUPCR|nr:unnamed protein product [Moneuplotes crassus]